jgi:predicted transcriptional regulator
MLIEYLSKLQGLGLLKVHHSQPRYVTTKKGLRFLDIWADLQSYLEPQQRHDVTRERPAQKWIDTAIPAMAPSEEAIVRNDVQHCS